MSETIAVRSDAVVTTADHEKVFNEILALDLNTCVVTVCLASVSKAEAIPHFERINITEAIAEDFRRVIENWSKRYKPEFDERNLLFPEYATQSKPEAYEIEGIDLSTCNMLLEQISPLLSLTDIEVFDEDKKFVDGLRFYVIAVQPPDGGPAYFFRLYGGKKMLGRSPWFAAWLNGGSYDRITSPLLLFDEEIDCVIGSAILFHFNKNNFQQIFRFFEEVRKTAKVTLDTIKTSVSIQNFDEFARDCEGHLIKLRKLKNIAGKPYLSRITMDHIKKVIQNNNLPLQIVMVEDKEMLVYDPKDKWVILKLLDDDYLWSMLTEQGYEVTGKREIP
jgi:Domain of unknown function (DUF4868)